MRNDFESNYLAHHGILGMKWGKRNGPPYPLGASDHSASEKKAGWRKSLGDSYVKAMNGKADKRQKQADAYAQKHGKRSSTLDRKALTAKQEAERVSSKNTKEKTKNVHDEKSQGKHLTDEQKRLIRNGAIAAGVALGVVGAMYVTKKAKLNPSHVAFYKYGKKLDISKLSNETVTFPKDLVFQRISNKSVEDYITNGKSIYASFSKKDNHLYKEIMPKYIKAWSSSGVIQGGKDAYVHKLQLSRDIKIAPEKEWIESYMKANKVDEVDLGNLRTFVTNLADRNNPVNKEFFEDITRKGFDGLFDMNDMSSSFAEAPVILINPADIIKSSKSHKLRSIEKVINVLTS